MPTKTGKPLSSYYGNDLTINQSSNTGIDGSTREIQDGFGNNTAILLSDDVLFVKPQNDNTTRTLAVQNAGGDIILAVSTTNSKVYVGASQVEANTQFKEMGLYDFSPTAGVHNPLIANNMMQSDSGSDIVEDTSMFGNGTDPATTLDLDADGTPKVAVACYWRMLDNMSLDEVFYTATADGSATLNFHLYSYLVDSATGDLSDGTVHANASVAATSTTAKQGTFTLDTADIDINRVVIGFVENVTDTSDVTVAFQIQYHIR